jgi:hypothetical protein
MEKQSAVIAEVEDFIKRFDNGILVLSSEGKKATYWIATEKNWLGRFKKQKQSLPDAIGVAVATYQKHKDMEPRLQLVKAYDLLDIIQVARAHGFVINLKQQARDYEQEIERLKEQIDNLKTLNDKLIAENKRLHNLVPDRTKGRGDTEIGDVEH